MAEIYDRTRMLVGDAGMEKLQNAHVFIAGIGKLQWNFLKTVMV